MMFSKVSGRDIRRSKQDAGTNSAALRRAGHAAVRNVIEALENRQLLSAANPLPTATALDVPLMHAQRAWAPEPTVSTDRLDYLPGQLASITGTGFGAHELVQVQVLHIDGTPNTAPEHRPSVVRADKNGTIHTSYLVGADDLDTTLRLTAVGQKTHRSAQEVFKDGTTPTTTTLTSSTPAPQAPIVKPTHIVVVVEETRAANAIGDTTDMPYFNQLASTGLVYSNSHGLNTTAQNAEMDYLALYSGSTQGVTDDADHGVFTTANLAQSLANSGMSFGGYDGSLPFAGDTTDDFAAEPGNPAYDDYYIRAENPMAQFSNVGTGLTNASVNLPFSSFPTTAAGYANLPTVSFVIPDTLHNTKGSNDTDPYATDPNAYSLLRQNADGWLQQNLDGYLQWAKQNNSLLIVTDSSGDRLHNFSAGFATVINGAPGLFAPGVDTTNVTPYNILRTIEDVYSLPPLGSTATASDLDINAQGQLGVPQPAGASTVGQAVSFTATVAPTSGTGTPTGTVQFTVDGANLGSPVALSNGSATSPSTNSLGQGSHNISAVYSSDATFAASAALTLVQNVSQASTTTTVGSSALSSVFGQSVTFTATVSAIAPGGGIPTGTVTFRDGSATLGTGIVNGSGQATFTTSALAVASHSITAVYGNTANYAASTSAAIAQSVSQDATTTGLTSSANPSTSGQAVTFTATVTAAAPGTGTPTGSVTFLDGAVTLGSGTLDGTGNATYTVGNLSVDTHAITAVYAGDGNFTTSTSAALSQIVGTGTVTTPTTTALASSLNPSTFGQAVTLTATVTSGATGTVTFLDGTTTLGTAALTSGTATYATSSLAAAAHSITASYAGDSNYSPSASAAFAQTVQQAATTVALTSSTPLVQAPIVVPSHIVVVVEEDRAAGAIGDTANMPYFNQLASSALVFNNTQGLNTASEDGQMTYLGLYSGDTQGVTDDSDHGVFTVPTLAQSLANNGLSFGGYAEALPYAGDTTDNYAADPNNPAYDDLYNRAYNPMAQFSNVGTGLTNANVNLPFSSFPTTASGYANLPTVSFVIPDTLHNTHGSNDTDPFATDPSAYNLLRQNADTWLQQNLDGYLQWAKQNNSLLIVTDDEGDRAHDFDAGYATIINGASNLFVPGVDTTSVNAYNILRTFEDMYNLPKLANSATAADLDITASGKLGVPQPGGSSTFGQGITFTATVAPVSPGAGTPTGTVQFAIDGVNFGSPAALNNGSATSPSITSLGLGSHNVTAVYNSDGNFSTNTSPTIVQNVAQASTTTTLVSSAISSVFSQSVTFTASVSAVAPGGGIPGGSVTFLDGSTTLGTGTVNGSGQATFTTSGLAVASHSITAVYGSTTNYAGSTSAAITQSVSQDASTTALTSSANPSTSGQSVTFTATVMAAAPGTAIPTGSVTFFDGAASLGMGTLDGTGKATFTTANLSVNAHSIAAVYAGDAHFTTSTSAALTQTVSSGTTTAPSTTLLASSVNPSVFGQPVTFTATVAPAGQSGNTPTGTVQFVVDGSNAGTPVPISNGMASSAAIAGLTVTGHTISALYSGDANFSPSSATNFTQTVNKSATAAMLASSIPSPVFGQSVTFTATVSVSAPGAGTAAGTVTFLDGTTTLGTGTLDGSGKATFATSSLAVASHSITAAYAGNSSFSASTSAAVNQSVGMAATTTALASSANPAVWGQGVTFTATVSVKSPGAGLAAGTVTFRDGSTTLGTGTLNGSGQATFSTSSLAVASHSITAVYAGNASFSASTSTAMAQTIGTAATAVALASSSNPATPGQSVTFTATISVVAPGAGTPTGTVTFFDGTTSIGSGTLNASLKATLTTSTLSAGSHSITASYAGDTHFSGKTSAVLTQQVTQATPPANDNFANATTITGSTATLTGTNVAATKQTGEPNHAGNAGGKSVWWTWKAPSTGVVTIDTAGSNFDTLLAVYTGSSVSALTAVPNGSNDNDPAGGVVTSKVSFAVTSGTTYKIAVDGANGASGSITLHLNLAVTPAAPTGVTASQGAFTNKVHLSWTAPAGATAYEVWRNTTNSSSTATKISTADVTTTAYDDTTAVAGTTYYYFIKGKNIAGTSGFSASAQGYLEPANDNFASATVITGASATLTGTNLGASKETGEPKNPVNAGGKSVWYTWTATKSGTVTIDTKGSNFDTLLTVFTGTSLTTLTQVAANDDDPAGGTTTSKVSFAVTAGTTYKIAVDGYGGASGNITLHLNLV